MTDNQIPAELVMTGIAKVYGTNRAIDDISATVPAGQVTVIVGPSGAGKTTLLRIICGLDAPTSGQVHFDGAPIDGVPDGLAMVFQDYSRSLFPWLRVEANVGFPLRRIDKKLRRSRVMEALEAVGLAGKEHLYPWEMSGGMQQRVAIARALACHPRLLVMDEPYASVDAQTRAELEDLLLTIQATMKITVLVVTHDIDESVYLADNIIVLSKAPSRVSEEIPVRLARPRDQITTKEDAEFIRLRAHVLRLLRNIPEAPTGAGSLAAKVTA
ncbi:ABC transporter ATP-binding protein [Leekyejoonella antrihumi]|uniref:ABC transporter ATP-binding protein n=1 Tax=Leekyejoonella antrihumi TaxID=1660198 RepID=A0A563DYC1_9MICO|nr:ABC transporter ATP-binding protein [Leekyejoonella antrihumi]TWP34674.1 ABC transporter ATP-binding protein [Leekyejoonella antrihumi]